MQFHYFIGTGPEAEALIAETTAKKNAVDEARRALCQEYGASGLIEIERLGCVTGLVFDEKQSLPFLKKERGVEGNRYGYYPKLNTKAGKKLAAKLEQPGLVFDVSDHLIKTLKLSRCVAGPAATRTGMALYYSVAGWDGRRVSPGYMRKVARKVVEEK